MKASFSISKEKECTAIFNETQVEILRRYYDMLYPKTLKDNERVCLFLVKTDKNGKVLLNKKGEQIKYNYGVRNFEEYIEYIDKHRHNYHIYNALATVKVGQDGKVHRTKSDMRQQRVLFIDFDKKDYPDLKDAHDFTRLIKEKLPNVFLHSYYDSGHGYHYYIIISPTCKITDISVFNKELCSLVEADTKACLETQVARVPCTFNRKHPDENGKFPIVKEIDHYKKHLRQVSNFHPLDLENLKRIVKHARERFTTENIPELPLQEWEYDTGDAWNIKQYSCLCTEKVFREGAEMHERNTWMGRIIVWFAKQKYPDYKIVEKIKEWNTRCRPPKSIAETEEEINGWYKWFKENDATMSKIGGCWWNIEDERVREIVCKQCDKYYCQQGLNSYTSLSISEDKGVKMNCKVLTEGKLSSKGKNTMSGYEYLILTVLDKYMPKTGRTPFTVKNLKYRMQWKKNGKWQLCMDISTLKKALEDLETHKCIKIAEPTPTQCKKKIITYDDKVIKISRGLKELEEKNFIVFYYSVARAFICHQITQNEYKVYLCILNNLKNGKSCTLEKMNNTLDMGERNILRAIQSLEKASLIRIDHLFSTEKGIKYNMYYPIDTELWNEDTDIDRENNKNVAEWKISLIA